MNELQRDINEDAYSIVEGLISQKAWEFYHRYGGSFDDWKSEACYIFLKALKDFHGDRSRLSTWVWTKVYYGLKDIVKKRMRCPLHFRSIEDLSEGDYTYHDIIPCPNRKCITNLVEHLSDSSYELWNLILYPPDELEGILDANDPSSSLDVLIWYCEHKLHWTQEQIRISFKELKEICQA